MNPEIMHESLVGTEVEEIENDDRYPEAVEYADEIPCEVKLGKAALCAACPLVALLGDCPQVLRNEGLVSEEVQSYESFDSSDLEHAEPAEVIETVEVASTKFEEPHVEQKVSVSSIEVKPIDNPLPLPNQEVVQARREHFRQLLFDDAVEVVTVWQPVYVEKLTADYKDAVLAPALAEDPAEILPPQPLHTHPQEISHLKENVELYENEKNTSVSAEDVSVEVVDEIERYNPLEQDEQPIEKAITTASQAAPPATDNEDAAQFALPPSVSDPLVPPSPVENRSFPTDGTIYIGKYYEKETETSFETEPELSIETPPKIVPTSEPSPETEILRDLEAHIDAVPPVSFELNLESDMESEHGLEPEVEGASYSIPSGIYSVALRTPTFGHASYRDSSELKSQVAEEPSNTPILSQEYLTSVLPRRKNISPLYVRMLFGALIMKRLITLG